MTEYGLGLIPSTIDARDFNLSEQIHSVIRELEENIPLPSKFEITDNLTAVKNQGQEGTCVGFACTIGLKEFQEKQMHNQYIELSPRYLYQKCKEIDGFPNIKGTNIKTALEVLSTVGVCEWNYWPYKEGDVGTPAPGADDNAKKYTIQSYGILTTMLSVKICLFRNSPVIMAVPFFNSWYSDQVTKTGDIPKPDGTNKNGHAICVVGYNDENKKFKFKNSWGTNWGDNGYGYLPYEYFDHQYREAWSAVDYDINNNGDLKISNEELRRALLNLPVVVN